MQSLFLMEKRISTLITCATLLAIVTLFSLFAFINLSQPAITSTPPVAGASANAEPMSMVTSQKTTLIPKYIVIGWNNLGMHCYNPDFSNLSILPPYNTLVAQVIKVGDPPQIVTSGVKVRYSFPDNTYSVERTGRPDKLYPGLSLTFPKSSSNFRLSNSEWVSPVSGTPARPSRSLASSSR